MTNFLAQIISVKNIFENLYVADFFDVIIIALLIYAIIFLFKQTRSFYIATGVGIVVALYVLSKAFGLFLTSLVFQAFWGVFFIAIVVIFQEELRRFFEYLAIWSSRQVKRGSVVTQPEAVREVLDAVKQMARDKIGALIVIEGHDPLAKFISGGKMLDGIVSEELLLSIFDPTSIGHDGALIVNGDRVVLFGGHLPLSRDFGQIGKRGTRHSAALGLAEVSDAFVIVVSEERGVVSYAYQGKLKTLEYAEEVSLPLQRFFMKTFPARESSPIQDLIRRNSLEKLFSVILAVILWFFFSFQAATVQRDFTVPVSYKNTGDSMLIEETRPNEITVTLVSRGATSFDLLDTKSLAVAIDASNFTAGPQKIAIAEESVSKPSNFTVINIEPREITATVRLVKLIDMAVIPKISGKVAAGFEIAKIVASPEKVLALVPEDFDDASALVTEPIAVDNLRVSVTLTAKIVIPNGVLLKEKSDPDVEVKIEIRKR